MGKRVVFVACLLGACALVFAGFAMRGARAPQSGSQVQVQLNVSPDIPLQIKDVQAAPALRGSQPITYRLVNNGSERLTAVEVSWQLTFAGGIHSRVVEQADYFLRPDTMQPRASDHFEIAGVTNENVQSAPLQSAAATITYAEFADGTRLGSNVRAASTRMDDVRTGELKVYNEALQAYRQAGEPALVQALDAEHLPPNRGGRNAWKMLNRELKENGVAAVVDDLNRVAQLKLPGT